MIGRRLVSTARRPTPAPARGTTVPLGAGQSPITRCSQAPAPMRPREPGLGLSDNIRCGPRGVPQQRKVHIGRDAHPHRPASGHVRISRRAQRAVVRRCGACARHRQSRYGATLSAHSGIERPRLSPAHRCVSLPVIADGSERSSSTQSLERNARQTYRPPLRSAGSAGNAQCPVDGAAIRALINEVLEGRAADIDEVPIDELRPLARAPSIRSLMAHSHSSTAQLP